MQIRTQADYDATPDEVFAILSDPAFVHDTVIRMSVADHSSEVVERGATTIITTVRSLPTDDFPEVAKRFVGEVLILREEQQWGPRAADGGRVAELKLRIDGAPVSVRGTLRLSPTRTGTAQDFQAQVTARVPLVGGSIERAAAPAVIAGIEAEVGLIKEWLDAS
ncbi:MAG TPA: DUF2505 domain-containing protein [Phycicoccus sp.]|nr:DUF2505 domain-containing protein [Phycicoccus sp.]